LAVDLRIAEKDGILLVNERKEHNMTAKFTCSEDTEAIVLVAVGSEVRVFKLGEFTDFWVPTIEHARKTHSEYLEVVQEMFTGKCRKKPEVTLA